MMVGRKVEFQGRKEGSASRARWFLKSKDLHGKDYRGVEILKGLTSVNVRRGEIVGLAGVDGNGQTELVEVLTGLRKGRFR